MSRTHSRKRPRRKRKPKGVPHVVVLVYEREAKRMQLKGEQVPTLRAWAQRMLSHAKVRRAVEGRCFGRLERVIDGWITRSKKAEDAEDDAAVASQVVDKAILSTVLR